MKNKQLPTSRAILFNKELVFLEDDGFEKALEFGIFYLKHPENMDFLSGEKFARSYYLDSESVKDEGYCGFKNCDIPDTKFGYSDPSDDQVELFQLEYNLWDKYLPKPVARHLKEMNELASNTLFSFWRKLSIPHEDWDKIASGVSENKALQYCIFNHYRHSRRSESGFTAHRDSGFITVLHTTEKGLETEINGVWMDVDPTPGYFTVVLGHSLEVLMKKTNPKVSASYHRVRPREELTQVPDRYSYGVYIGPRFDQFLFQYDESYKLEKYLSFLEFQKIKAAEMEYEFHPRVVGT